MKVRVRARSAVAAVLATVAASAALTGSAVANPPQHGGGHQPPPPGIGRAEAVETAVFQTARKFVSMGESFLLEGPTFDPTGQSLYLVKANTLERIQMSNRHVSTVLESPSSLFTGTEIGRDGRIYLASISENGGPGRIFSVDASGGDPRPVVTGTEAAPIYPDDLVFDSKGALFWTEMKGDALHPEGRVMLTSPDFSTTTTIEDGFAWANGIGISPDGRSLWVDEYLTGRVFRLKLNEAGDGIVRFKFGGGIAVAHQLQGLEGPDSMAIDSAGNVYVAHNGQGRVDVLDKTGKLVEVVTTPGYDEPTNIAIRPGTSTAYVTATDSETEKAAVLQFKALAPAETDYAEG